MCGIIGYTGKRDAAEVLISGLKSLEYRGYDSAGAAFFENGKIKTVKTAGKVGVLAEKLKAYAPVSACGIAHTRWATHGAPSGINAHPHTQGEVTLVHNGIIENHGALRAALLGEGYIFASETDTEVAAAEIDYCLRTKKDRLLALCKAEKQLSGSYAFALMFSDAPGTLFAAKKDSPLIIGLGEGENFIASDITAILKYTRKYISLSDGELAEVTPEDVKIYDSSLNRLEKAVQTAVWDIAAAEKGGYPHFMLKEINEEPGAIKTTVAGRIKDGIPDFSSDCFDCGRLAAAENIYIVACGTAMHAGLYGKYMIEKLARRKCEVEIASEFRYKDPILGKNDAAIVISQSGETADSLAALRLAKSRGAYAAAIVNVVASSIAREADGVLYTRAGPEIAVASTKAYTVQSSILLLLAVKLALMCGKIDGISARALTLSISEGLPALISSVISGEGHIKEAAEKIRAASDAFYIGRGVDRYLADEGSLKLKEISYIHSEAYAAGELKHGTISLIEPGVPVIAIATQHGVYEKTESNIREVRSRGALSLLIRGESLGDDSDAELIINLPSRDEAILPIAAVTACQLLAYHTATLRGTDVDMPRNLAKSVTVE